MERDAPRMTVTLLGTGTSTGVPVIGCTCRVCTSTDTRDKRTRCSCHIEVQGLHLLIDAGPDLRSQALRASLRQLDAVLLTHHHFDHVAGLDDLRPFLFFNRTPIPCYASPDCARILRRMFWYIFEDGSYPGVARLELCEVDTGFQITGRYAEGQSVRVQPIEVFHGALAMYGYRIGRFAYLTDTNRIPEESFDLLDDLDVLVLDALRHEPHRSHFTIDQAVAVAQRIGARQTYLIHMTHHILHAEEARRLPEGIALGFDGLCFDVE